MKPPLSLSSSEQLKETTQTQNRHRFDLILTDSAVIININTLMYANSICISTTINFKHFSR